jgi:hypothetical protein
MANSFRETNRTFTRGEAVSIERSFPVTPHSNIAIQAEIKAFRTDPDKNPALIRFKFFRDGENLSDIGDVQGLSRSDSIGYYAYLGARGAVDAIDFRKIIPIPGGVNRVSAAIVAWYAPAINVIRDVEIAPYAGEADEILWEHTAAVPALADLSLEATLSITECHPSRAPALVAFTFLDPDGQPVPHLPEGVGLSKKYGPYAYLGRPGDEGRQTYALRVTPPHGSARVAMRLFRLGAGSITLAKPPTADFRHIEQANVPANLLATIERAVREGESYDVTCRHSGSAVLTDGFALLRFAFLDERGWRVPHADSLAITTDAESYRTFGITGNDSTTGRVTLTVPAGAVRLRAEVLGWRLPADPGEVTIEAIGLGDGISIALQGAFAHDGSGAAVSFSARFAASGEPGRNPGLIEWLFEDTDGALLAAPVEGLTSTSRFPHCSPLRCWRDDGVLIARGQFVPPPGSHRILWRLRPHGGVTLAALGDLALSRLPASLGDIVRGLPPRARIAQGIAPDRCEQLRSALPATDLRGPAFDLLGEAATACTPGDWLELSARITSTSATLPPDLLVRPTFFDAEGKVIDRADQPGCRLRKNLGAVRHAAVAFPCPAGRALREAFRAPANAAFAMFHLGLANTRVDVDLLGLELAAIAPGEVLASLDTTIMGRAQLVAAAELADAAGNLAANHALALALASLAPKDPKLAQQARALADDLRLQSREWLPPLPDYPPAATDAQSVLHLVAGLDPDDSSAATAHSRAIMAAQAACGLHPVACLPLNPPHPPAPHPARDGITQIMLGGIMVCYPHYPGFKNARLGRTERLALDARLASRVIREKRVSLIHAVSGTGADDSERKAVALARAHDLPLVYEVRPLSGSGTAQWPTAPQTRCLLAADAVVAGSEALVQTLAELGVAREKLFLVADSALAESPVPPEQGPAPREALARRYDEVYAAARRHHTLRTRLAS